MIVVYLISSYKIVKCKILFRIYENKECGVRIEFESMIRGLEQFERRACYE